MTSQQPTIPYHTNMMILSQMTQVLTDNIFPTEPIQLSALQKSEISNWQRKAFLTFKDTYINFKAKQRTLANLQAGLVPLDLQKSGKPFRLLPKSNDPAETTFRAAELDSIHFFRAQQLQLRVDYFLNVVKTLEEEVSSHSSNDFLINNLRNSIPFLAEFPKLSSKIVSSLITDCSIFRNRHDLQIAAKNNNNNNNPRMDTTVDSNVDQMADLRKQVASLRLELNSLRSANDNTHAYNNNWNNSKPLNTNRYTSNNNNRYNKRHSHMNNNSEFHSRNYNNTNNKRNNHNTSHSKTMNKYINLSSDQKNVSERGRGRSPSVNRSDRKQRPQSRSRHSQRRSISTNAKRQHHYRQQSPKRPNSKEKNRDRG